MIELLPVFGNVRTLMTDNEAAFCSPSAKCAYNLLNITHKTTPPAHSKSNGIIERIHSTLTELIRIVKETTHITDIKDVMTLATKKYNETIHTVTDKRPTDIFHNYIDNGDTKKKLQTHQQKMLGYHNRNRKNKTYKVGETIFVNNGQRRSKNKPLFQKKEVKEDLGNVVIDSNNRKIHKDNIRN